MPNGDTDHRLAASDGRPRAPRPQILQSVYALPASSSSTQQPEDRLERLTDRLPTGLQANVRWLRRPSSRRVRIPARLLLIGGGVLSIPPLLALWMLALGFMLLAEDEPLPRRWRDRVLDCIERLRPYWLRETISSANGLALPCTPPRC
jgi:hypothetical protein